MNVLVVGSGGREHALTWKIAQSSKVTKIYAAPGNPGIGKLAEIIPIKANEITKIADFALSERIDLTVVGPEEPLALGIVDLFEERRLKVFGPSQRAAEIESSKAFAKRLMAKYDIPTASFEVFESAEDALEYIDRQGTPIVIKADGLAAGKGSIVAENHDEAVAAIEKIMRQRIFGDSGNRVVIEEFLRGEEASILAVTDGETILPLAPSQDHKPIYDGDRGPNTGGMGAYAPAPLITDQMMKRVYSEILVPTINGLAKEGRIYKGILYAGLFITAEGPKVIEFNCRFGDPETQVVVPLLKTDLVELMLGATEARLDKMEIEEQGGAAVCVVVASGGYPGSYQKGKEIHGLEALLNRSDVIVFHAGTTQRDNRILTDGGRVLGVTAVADDIPGAIQKAYDTVNKVHFEGMYYRTDIGKKALMRMKMRL